MKVFIACLGTETNTFSPMPTGDESFAETMLYRGDATAHPPVFLTAPLHAWRSAAEAGGETVIESIAAFATPAGPVVRRVYEGLRDELLVDLEKALPVDMVLLSMHGAMVADGYDDCEGDILGRARRIAGPDAALGAELDLHCSITPEMIAAADALVTFKEYPHIDPRERAEELYAILAAKARGETRPVMAIHDCRMIGAWHTTREPMKSFVARMRDLEGKDGILSISFAHGFPWGDVPHMTARMVVISDGDEKKAAALARQLGNEIWEMREETRVPYVSIGEALDRAEAAPRRPVVLADASDNAGGGAPSDATFILRAILERGIGDVATGLYWDPMAVRFCKEAGEGATLDLRIGGKSGPASGDPVDLSVKVMAISDNASQIFGEVAAPIGEAAWVRARNGLDLVLNSVRTQTFGPDAFTQFGIDLANKNIVVVKSSQHFHAGFAPIAGDIVYVAAGGALDPDFANLPFVKFKGPYWPKVEDPFVITGDR